MWLDFLVLFSSQAWHQFPWPFYKTTSSSDCLSLLIADKWPDFALSILQGRLISRLLVPSQSRYMARFVQFVPSHWGHYQFTDKADLSLVLFILLGRLITSLSLLWAETTRFVTSFFVSLARQTGLLVPYKAGVWLGPYSHSQGRLFLVSQ